MTEDMHIIVKNLVDALADSDSKYLTLLEFVKDIRKRSCCNVCECISCDALDVLRKIGEE